MRFVTLSYPGHSTPPRIARAARETLKGIEKRLERETHGKRPFTLKETNLKCGVKKRVRDRLGGIGKVRHRLFRARCEMSMTWEIGC